MIWDWIEGRRRSLELPDHRSASGRATWAAMVAMLSFGPAGMLASLIGLRRGLQWTQPAAVTGTILSFSASLFAFTAWVPDFSEYYHWTIMAIGIICLLGLIWSIVRKENLDIDFYNQCSCITCFSSINFSISSCNSTSNITSSFYMYLGCWNLTVA